jgi:hypothetical protein
MYRELVIAQSICGEISAILDSRYPGCGDRAYEHLVAAVQRYSNDDVVHCSDADLSAMLRSALQAITKYAPLPSDLTELIQEFRAMFDTSEYDDPT